MANPQKENGYTSVANEIAEVLAKTYLSSQESRILWVILRQTWGYTNKKMDRISFSQFEQKSGIDRRHIAPVIKRLVRRNIIIRKRDGQNIFYGIQKDYDQWDKAITQTGNGLLKQSITQTGNIRLPKQVTKPLPKQVNTKQKQKLNKEERATLFAEKVYSNNGYPKDDLEDFIEYWTESGEEQIKMRFELEKTFDISRRIKKWMNNKRKWTKFETIKSDTLEWSNNE